MAFWSDIARTPEPLRQNRWYLRFGTELDNIVFALMECGKPEVEISVTEHLLLNHYFKYPGLVKWKPINIKFVSAYSPVNSTKDGTNYTHNVAATFDQLLANSGYRNPEMRQDNHLNKIDMSNNISGVDRKAAEAGATGIKTAPFELIQIDADGKPIDLWRIFNPLITNIKYGTLSYSSDEFVTVEATINYDFADYIMQIKEKK